MKTKTKISYTMVLAFNEKDKRRFNLAQGLSINCLSLRSAVHSKHLQFADNFRMRLFSLFQIKKIPCITFNDKNIST